MPTPSSHMQVGISNPYTDTPVHIGPTHEHTAVHPHAEFIYMDAQQTDPACICGTHIYTPTHVRHMHMRLHSPELIEAHSLGHVRPSVSSQTPRDPCLGDSVLSLLVPLRKETYTMLAHSHV